MNNINIIKNFLVESVNEDLYNIQVYTDIYK